MIKISLKIFYFSLHNGGLDLGIYPGEGGGLFYAPSINVDSHIEEIG